ncbi:MAG TPA: glycosyltransferase family 87 protein, partial [Pseudonocardia sp.]|nr:glycosyltransferase family 87 protein [Pseudonocardia sp.]
MTTDTGRAGPPPEPARPRVPRRPGRRLQRAVLLVAPAALAASFALMLREHPPVLIDLQVYRWAVATWLDGGDILGEAPVTSVGIALPWVYPPFALLPLSAVSLVPFPVGAGILYALDLLALGGTLYLVARHLWPHAGTPAAVAVAAALLPFTLFLEPVYASFGLGQVNIVLMGLVAADCLAERPRWPRGVLIGIAAAVKLTPAVFVLFLLLRRDVRAAVVAVATAAVATGIGFLVDTTASLDYWFGRGPAAGVSASAYRTNQSVAGGLARLDLAPLLGTVLWVLLALVLLAMLVYRVRRVDAAPGVAATGLLALLVSPTSWS